MTYNIQTVMNFLFSLPFRSLQFLCLSCFIVFSANLDAREVEVFLGKKAIAARNIWSVPSSMSSTIEIAHVTEMKQYLKKLDANFKMSGGYDLLGKAAFVRWAWLSSKDKSWIMQIPFTPKNRKNILDSLYKASWQKRVDGVFENSDLIISVKAEKVLLGRNLDLDSLVQQSTYWNIPKCDWFEIRAFKSMFDELARRQPRLDALLSYLSELNLSWNSGDLVADIQLTDSERATALVVSANAGLQFIKNFVINKDSYKEESWHLLDFVSFSRQSVNSKALEQMFDRLLFQSYGKVFQVKYVGVGDFGKFLTNILPQQIFTLLVSILPKYSQHRDQLAKFINPGIANSSKLADSKTDVQDSCGPQMKMIEQAVEFYNLDHLKQGEYKSIKAKLFEEGYLPEDLRCEGKLVKDNKLFIEESGGNIVRFRQGR